MTFESLQSHEAYVLPYLAHDYRRKGLERLVQRYVTGKRVLDVRCLTGQLAVDLALKGFDVTGLDAHVKGVEISNAYARARGLPRDIARFYDLEHLVEQVHGQPFDTVICLDTLHHVPHDERLLAQIAHVLVDGGRLLVATSAFPFLHRHRDKMLGPVRRYSRSGIRGLLTRHGFEIRFMRYWNLLGLVPYLLIERVINVQIPEHIRYRREGSVGSRLLHWWYFTIENRLPFPIGLTHFIVAQKRPIGNTRKIGDGNIGDVAIVPD